MSFISLSPCLFNSLLSQTFFFSIFLFFTWSLSQSISFCRSLCLLDYFFKSFSISLVFFLNLSLSLNSYQSLSGFPLFSGFFILSTHLSLLFLKFSLSPSVFSLCLLHPTYLLFLSLYRKSNTSSNMWRGGGSMSYSRREFNPVTRNLRSRGIQIFLTSSNSDRRRKYNLTRPEQTQSRSCLGFFYPRFSSLQTSNFFWNLIWLADTKPN